MTNKVDIRRLDSTTINDTAATALINENFEALQTAIENTLSRDGTTPNYMDADLDLNSYKIINAGDPENDHDVITKGWFDQFVEDASTAASDANAAAARAASSAQTASVSAQNAEASASAALDDALLAKDWATKMDGTVDGVDYSSKYYASQIIPIATDISTVAGIASDVTTVAGISSDVTDVADIKNDVTTVSGIASDVTAVKNNATDISAVAANETNINTVASDSTSINAVADDLTSIDAVYANATNINAVNANKTNIDAVAGSISNVNAVAGNATNINTVAGIDTDVTTTAGIASDVTAVANNGTDISAVAADLTNIDAVAADLTNIDNASQYAAAAKQWAIGDPTEPTGNSAKYWADYAEDIAESIGNPANIDLSNLSQTGEAKFTNLQQQIDAIVVSSDVFDVVGTYADLQAYDITTVPVNDIIKVLEDSTHNNAMTYYRCTETGGVKSWTYIGSEGPFYTKAETDAKYSTIASTGASLDYTGTTLSLENSSGTVLSSVTIQSSPDIDDKSITKNSSQELQTVGIIDQNNTSNAIKTWTGTKAQYDAILSKDPNTLYNNTDSGEIYLGNTLLSNYGADTSLSNLSSTGANIANWSSNVTNCITEIPQDIKLELSNGTLTLKAGSKLYVPNGFEADGTTPHYDIVTIDSDKTLSSMGSATGQCFLFWNKLGNSWGYTQPSICTIGTTPPSNGTFWNTSTNTIKYYENGSDMGRLYSIPFALVTRTSGTPSSIDKTLNGFSYFSNRVIALPGVKGLAPNGRNADGTYNTRVVSVNSVLTRDITGTGYKEFTLSSAISWGTGGYFVDEDGYLYSRIGNSKALSTVIFGSCDIITAGTFNKISFKKAFHIPSWQDAPGLSMPDYSAGIAVNATSYTAPKNGIVLINCVHVDNSSNNASINGVQVYSFSMSGSYANGTMTPFETPVSAGDVITSNRNILKFYPYKGA